MSSQHIYYYLHACMETRTRAPCVTSSWVTTHHDSSTSHRGRIQFQSSLSSHSVGTTSQQSWSLLERRGATWSARAGGVAQVDKSSTRNDENPRGQPSRISGQACKSLRSRRNNRWRSPRGRPAPPGEFQIRGSLRAQALGCQGQELRAWRSPMLPTDEPGFWNLGSSPKSRPGNNSLMRKK